MSRGLIPTTGEDQIKAAPFVRAATAGLASAQTVELLLTGSETCWSQGETRAVTVAAVFSGGGSALVAVDLAMDHTNAAAANAEIDQGQSELFSLNEENSIVASFTTSSPIASIEIISRVGFFILNRLSPSEHILTTTGFPFEMPTPGGIAMLGVDGLMAGRRRRRRRCLSGSWPVFCGQASASDRSRI